jgi:FKBP-type peptidyl-prolyl cis-trans isomerase
MKPQRLFTGILIFVLTAWVITGCDMGGHKGYKKTGSGIYYKIESIDNTDTNKVAVGKIVTMEMKYYMDDTVLFDSKDRPGEMRFAIGESQYEGDFYEALTLFSQGDSGTFILQAEPFFQQTIGQKELPDYVSEGDEIYFDFYFRKVQTQQQVEEEEAALAEDLRQMEPESIRKFVEDKQLGVDPDDDGIYFIEKEKGKGRSPKTDDYAIIHFSVSLLNGEQLFSSREQGEPLEFQIGSKFENDGFQRVVQKMKTGGEANALVPSALAFGEQGMGNIVPPYSPLFYEIELLDVMTQEEYTKKQEEKATQKKAEDAKREQQESVDLQNYLNENNITAEPTASGLIYVETEEGTGPQPQAGQRVKVHYTGKLLDGTKFDSSLDRGQPFEFALGQGQVIKGWDEGIALMKEGGKATLIIPSKIGYGAGGAGEMIPPFATLVFDVELLEVVE